MRERGRLLKREREKQMCQNCMPTMNVNALWLNAIYILENTTSGQNREQRTLNDYIDSTQRYPNACEQKMKIGKKLFLFCVLDKIPFGNILTSRGQLP